MGASGPPSGKAVGLLSRPSRARCRRGLTPSRWEKLGRDPVFEGACKHCCHSDLTRSLCQHRLAARCNLLAGFHYIPPTRNAAGLELDPIPFPSQPVV